MNWWDYGLTAVSVLCTAVSLIGAYRSNLYYKKSKGLTLYANTNIAFIESKSIIALLTELLRFGNQKVERGINCAKEISQRCEKIKLSLNRIRECLPVEDYTEVVSLLNCNEIQVERYVDSLITGSALVDGRLEIDDSFYAVQTAFQNVQFLLRKNIDDLEERIK